MAPLVLPRVQAMLICDDVTGSAQEKGVYYLNGVRHTISFAAFPATRQYLCVFLHLSGHRGEATCKASIYQALTDAKVFESNPKVIKFDEPTIVVPFLLRLRNCVFPAPGVYYVEVVADGKVIGERRLELTQE